MSFRKSHNPILKDKRPRHSHPTKREMYYTRCRPCAVCSRPPMETPHHVIPKAAFKVPGVSGVYYDYITIGEEWVWKEDWLAALCLTCHEGWHNAFGQTPPTGPMQNEIAARKAGLRKWRRYIEKHKHHKLFVPDIMQATVHPLWLQDWMDSEFPCQEVEDG